MNQWTKKRDLLIEETLAFVQGVASDVDRTTDSPKPTPLVQHPAGAIEPAPKDWLTMERALRQKRVANFIETQQKFQREREAYCAMTMTNARATQWTPAGNPRAEGACMDVAKDSQRTHPRGQISPDIDAVATARPDQTEKLSAKPAEEPEHTGPSDHDSISHALAAIDRALSKASNDGRL